MAKEVIKDPGFLYLSVLSSPHGHKMAAAAPIPHIFMAAFKAERTQMVEGGSNLLGHFSFFRKKNISKKSPDQDPC